MKLWIYWMDNNYERHYEERILPQGGDNEVDMQDAAYVLNGRLNSGEIKDYQVELRPTTWKEYIADMKTKWVGKKVFFRGQYHNVVDVDYNGALLIDLPAQFTETTAIDPAQVDPAGII